MRWDGKGVDGPCAPGPYARDLHLPGALPLLPTLAKGGAVRRGMLASWTVLAVVLAGCASSSVAQRQPEALDDGVQATGRLDGGRIAVSDGSPETNLVDCDPGDGPDEDVCWIARTIDGLTIAFVVENPGVLAAGETVPVRSHDCERCDDVREQAVVDLRIAGDQRRATSGRLVVREADERFAADFRIRFGDGDEVTGAFNIRQMGPGER